MEKKVVDYMLVRETDEEALDDLVTGFLERRWQPYGSPFVDEDGDDCQAMVRYE